MKIDYYHKQLEQLEELTTLSADKQAAFFQHILLVSASILGILISLHSNSSTNLYIRLVFALSTVLLTLGILTTSIAVYDHSQLVERSRQAFRKEVRSALDANRKVDPVFVGKKKRTVFCEITSYILLLTTLLSLATYAVLMAFYP